MEHVRIANFGEMGVQTDPQSQLLEPGAWSWLSNIDIESGDVRSAWGDTLITNAPPIEPLYTTVYAGATQTWLVISDGESLYAYDGTTWLDITPYQSSVTETTFASADADLSPSDFTNPFDIDGPYNSGDVPLLFAGDVTFTVFLGTLVITPSEGIPSYWPLGGGRCQRLPGWDDSWRALTIVAFTNHLVAIGYNDQTITGEQYRVAWSDAAAEGEIPQTWLPAPENQAGSVQLRDTDGYLVTAAILRDQLIIYKNDSVYRMYLRGDEFVMGFERVVESRGCDSIHGVSPLDNVHFFADRGDIWMFDGQSTQSIAARRINEALTAGISNQFRDKTYVQAYAERNEVWVGIVPAGLSAISSMLVYNINHDAWTLKYYPNAVSMTLGPFTVAQPDTQGETYATYIGSFADADDSINGAAFEPSEDGIILGSRTQIWRADKTNTDQNGNPKSCYAERNGFLIKGMDRMVTLKRVYPEFEADEDAVVNISIGYRYRLGAVTTWTVPRPFNPRTDRSVPVRVTGQPCAFRVSSNIDKGWRLGALGFDFTDASAR